MRFDYNYIFLVPSEFYKSEYKIALIKEYHCFGKSDPLNEFQFNKISPVLYKTKSAWWGEYYEIKSHIKLKINGTFYFYKEDAIFVNK
jgi:hypothetical protein